jgi:hypothetical protein
MIDKPVAGMSDAEFSQAVSKILSDSWSRVRNLDRQVAERSYLNTHMPDHARWQKRHGYEPPKPAPTDAEAAVAAVAAAQAAYDAAVLEARRLGVEPNAKTEAPTDGE